MSRKSPVVTLGDQLRAARTKLKKTQLQIAIEAGIRPEIVNRLENNRSPASLVSLHKLAPVLGLDLNDLVAGANLTAALLKDARKTKGKK